MNHNQRDRTRSHTIRGRTQETTDKTRTSSIVRCVSPSTGHSDVANNKTRKLMLSRFGVPLIVFWNGQTTVPSTSLSLDPSRLIYAQLSMLVLSEN